MSEVTGMVAAVSSKELSSGTYHSFCVEDVWYRTGRDKAPVEKGYKVRFTFSEDKYGKHVDLSTLKFKEGEAPPSAGKAPYKGKPQSSSAFWENKEIRDIDTQKRISFQAAANTAINIVNGALDRELLPLPKGKVADKFGAYQAMLMEETVRLYKLYQEVPDNSEDYLTNTEVEVVEDSFAEEVKELEDESGEDEWS